MPASQSTQRLISFDDAYRIVMDAVRVREAETTPLPQALYRVLAQEVRADMAMPPYNKSMVDGYACRRADLHQPLRIVETVAAGYAPKKVIGPGECAKIMTGAMIPEGADCVFMVEQAESEGEERVRFVGEDTGDNIAPQGKDIEAGALLLEPGQRILAPEIAVLAAMGCVQPEVYGRARVAVIATGDEIVEPEETPSTVQIRNSNGYQLCAQAERMGCCVTYLGVARDNEASIEEALKRGLDEHDVILFSGGVSMGEFDLVPKVLEGHGIRIQFDRVAIQPGKPTTFAMSDDIFCFGLPGNPVSTFVIFELLVKPFLFATMGHAFRPPVLRAPLGEPFRRKSGARKAWVPVATNDDGTLRRIEYHGSAHINALCHADGLIPFPQGVTEMDAGTVVEVRLICD